MSERTKSRCTTLILFFLDRSTDEVQLNKEFKNKFDYMKKRTHIPTGPAKYPDDMGSFREEYGELYTTAFSDGPAVESQVPAEELQEIRAHAHCRAPKGSGWGSFAFQSRMLHRMQVAHRKQVHASGMLGLPPSSMAAQTQQSFLGLMDLPGFSVCLPRQSAPEDVSPTRSEGIPLASMPCPIAGHEAEVSPGKFFRPLQASATSSLDQSIDRPQGVHASLATAAGDDHTAKVDNMLLSLNKLKACGSDDESEEEPHDLTWDLFKSRLRFFM